MDVKEFVERKKVLEDFIANWVKEFEQDANVEITRVDARVIHIQQIAVTGIQLRPPMFIDIAVEMDM